MRFAICPSINSGHPELVERVRFAICRQMPRIAGVVIPDNKRIEVALTYIYGIGPSRVHQIISAAGLNADTRAKDLTTGDISKIREYIERNFQVEGELRQRTLQNIRLLRDIATYRGSRHAKRLPVRGQRTRTNSRTVRGNVRRTVGSGRRKTEKT